MSNLNELDATGYDTVKANGIVISTQVFKWFADDVNSGRIFKFINNQDGNVTIETLTMTDRIRGNVQP